MRCVPTIRAMKTKPSSMPYMARLSLSVLITISCSSISSRCNMVWIAPPIWVSLIAPSLKLKWRWITTVVTWLKCMKTLRKTSLKVWSMSTKAITLNCVSTSTLPQLMPLPLASIFINATMTRLRNMPLRLLVPTPPAKLALTIGSKTTPVLALMPVHSILHLQPTTSCLCRRWVWYSTMYVMVELVMPTTARLR